MNLLLLKLALDNHIPISIPAKHQRSFIDLVVSECNIQATFVANSCIGDDDPTLYWVTSSVHGWLRIKTFDVPPPVFYTWEQLTLEN